MQTESVSCFPAFPLYTECIIIVCFLYNSQRKDRYLGLGAESTQEKPFDTRGE